MDVAYLFYVFIEIQYTYVHTPITLRYVVSGMLLYLYMISENYKYIPMYILTYEDNNM